MSTVSIWLRERSLAVQASVLLAANVLLILSAQFEIRLWFTPVPVTAQTFAVLLIGATLGWRHGAAVVSAYLAQGAVGLPVFAGLKGGPAVLFGPTGGYLIGFLVAVVLVGWIVEKARASRWLVMPFAMGIGVIAIYACGLPVVAAYTGWGAALAAGVVPFVIGDLVKAALAAAVAAAAAKPNKG